MPRSPSGVYSAPPGTTAVSGQTIASASYNAFKDDLVQDANAARPLGAGGTGAATDVLARENLGVYGRSFLIDTTGTTAEKAYDNQVIEFTTSGTLSTEPAADLGDGWRCYVFASGGVVTINPNLDETINGLATLVIPMGASGVLSVYSGNFRFEFYGSANQSRFLAHKNGVNQAVVINSAKITFGTEAYDDGGYYDAANSRWTPPAGRHYVSVAFTGRQTTNPTGTVALTLELRKNDVAYARGFTTVQGANFVVQATLSRPIEANGTDYFEIWGVNENGNYSGDIRGAVVETWFSAHAI